MHLEYAVLRWLLGLSLLTEPELATLCQAPLKSVQEAVRHLRHAGWLYQCRLSDPDASGDDVVAVSAAGLRYLRDNPAFAQDALGEVASWQCSLRVVGEAVAQAAVTRATNRAIVAVAQAAQDADLGSLTWASRIADRGADPSDGGLRPRMPWGHAEVRWQSDGWEARFAVYADSHLVPSAQRRRTLAAWRREIRGARGIAADAPILILTRRPLERAFWKTLHKQAADRHGSRALPEIGLAQWHDARGPYAIDEPVWWTPRRGRWLALSDLVHWQAVPGDEDAEPWPQSELPRLGSVTAARKAMERPPRRASRGQRTAALALRLSEPEHRIVDLLADEPWLAATDIARIEDDPREMVQRRLVGLAQRGVASAARADDGPRWVLRTPGRDLVAARAGFVRRSTQFAEWTSLLSLDEPPTEVKEHQACVSRAVGLLAAAARRDGWSMTWYTEGYWTRELQQKRPRPDGFFFLRRADGEPLWGLLEYERALPGGKSPTKKLAAWVQWYAERRWRRIFGKPPLLLFVYGDYGRAPGSLVRAVEECSPSLPICVGHEHTLDEHGLDGEVWSRAGGGPAVSALALARAAVEAASSPPSADR